MNYTAQQFIAMPDFLNLKQQNLKYLDALTYVTIRSFDSNEKEYCYPSYTKIMERSGLGRTFLASSIDRLEDANLLQIVRSNREGTCNRYYFNKLEHFEMFSYDVLFKTDELSPNEKAMLICLRQFFVHGRLSCSYSITDFAKQLGVSYKQVYGPLKSLISKEYIKEINIINTYSAVSRTYYKLTSKISWPLPKPVSEAKIIVMPKIKVA